MRQNRVGGAGRTQDVDPSRVVEIGVVWSDRAKSVKDVQEGINGRLHEISFSLIKEKMGDQCSCAVLVDGGVVDEPVHGSGEIRPCPP